MAKRAFKKIWKPRRTPWWRPVEINWSGGRRSMAWRTTRRFSTNAPWCDFHTGGGGAGRRHVGPRRPENSGAGQEQFDAAAELVGGVPFVGRSMARAR